MKHYIKLAFVALVLAPMVAVAGPWDDFAGYIQEQLYLERELDESAKIEDTQKRGSTHALIYQRCICLRAAIVTLQESQPAKAPITRALADLLEGVVVLEQEVIRIRTQSPSLRPATPVSFIRLLEEQQTN